jgi:hypothetical protein
MMETNTNIALTGFLTLRTGKANKQQIINLCGIVSANIMAVSSRRRFRNEKGIAALKVLDSAQHNLLFVIERARTIGRYVFRGDEIESVLDALEICSEVFKLTAGNFEFSDWYAELGSAQSGARKHGFFPYFVTATEHIGAGQVKRYYQVGNRQIPYYLGNLDCPEVSEDKQEQKK